MVEPHILNTTLLPKLLNQNLVGLQNRQFIVAGEVLQTHNPPG